MQAMCIPPITHLNRSLAAAYNRAARRFNRLEARMIRERDTTGTISAKLLKRHGLAWDRYSILIDHVMCLEHIIYQRFRRENEMQFEELILS
jgi:transposase-like protein